MRQQKEDGWHGKCVIASDDGGIGVLTEPFTHEMFCDEIATNILAILSRTGWAVTDENVFREEVGYTIYETSTWMASQTKITPTYVSLPSLANESRVASQNKTSLNAQTQESCWLTKKPDSSPK
jgi:hypothetical protein